jgi:membrane-bound acyltransferase YfiQ involved in biofilm formation
VGIVIGQYKDKILNILNNKYGEVVVSLMIIFALAYGLYVILPSFNIVGYLICSNISSITFGLIMLAMCYKIKLCNPFTQWLGNISYSVYLVHMMIIKVVNEFTTNVYVRVCGVMVVSVIIGYGITLISNRILKFCLEWRRERE